MFGWSSSKARDGGSGENTLADGTCLTLALYKYDACPYCQRVMRAVDALGVNVDYRDTMRDRRWREDLVKRAGGTQVPALLIDGERVLLESADIIDWLRERFAAPT